MSSFQTLQKTEMKYKETKPSCVTPPEEQTEVSSMFGKHKCNFQTENSIGYFNYLFMYQLYYVLLSRDICII